MDVIFDTDIGSDCDDMLALALLLYAQRKGECNIKAIGYSQKLDSGVATLCALYNYFGDTMPPIGLMHGGVAQDDKYCDLTVERFGNNTQNAEIYDDCIDLMRKTLAESESKVTICAVGPLTNIAALINSRPDYYSELNGRELLKQKCDRIVTMSGGAIEDEGDHFPEYNARVDVEATRTVLQDSPVDVIVSPVELGLTTLTAKNIVNKYNGQDPLTFSYLQFPDGKTGRHSCDPVTVLYMLYGVCDYFTESKKGNMTVCDNGATYFTEDAGGNCTWLCQRMRDNETEEESRKRVAEIIDSAVESIMK